MGLLFNFFKNRPRYINVDAENGSGNSKKSKVLIFVIIVAILILAFSGTGGTKKEDKAIAKDSEGNELLAEQYIAENEKRLKTILETVQGAGKVGVMITVEDIGEKVIAENEKTENDRENDGEKTSSSQNKEQTAILYGSGADERPFVLKEKLPLPSGVLVVATGAGDERVRLEIYEAVKALYGISGHRIKVTKGNMK